jgi:hypothetical protein
MVSEDHPDEGQAKSGIVAKVEKVELGETERQQQNLSKH